MVSCNHRKLKGMVSREGFLKLYSLNLYNQDGKGKKKISIM